MIVETILSLATAAEGAHIQFIIDFSALLMQVRAVPPLACTAELARLSGLDRTLAKLFAHSGPLLDNILRYGTEAGR
jgi:hypothetical protein